MELTVEVLIIDHKHGKNVYVCKNEEIAHRELYKYVKDYWNLDVPLPNNNDEAIGIYFTYWQGTEWYDLDTHLVIGSD